MSSPARPALAEVLGMLTERDASWWRSWMISPHLRGGVEVTRGGASFCVRADWRRDGVTHDLPWLHATPAEALEALATAGLWPWSPGEGPRWWCDACGCSGAVTARGGRGGQVVGGIRCDCASCATTREECDRTGEEYVSDLRAPSSHAALVAVTSLSAPTLTRAAELAAEIARHAGCEGATLAWRVMRREAIEAQRKAVAWGAAPSTIVDAFILGAWQADDLRRSYAANARNQWRPEVVSREINESLPMLGDLHALGVHLVALDARRIVLAVEAIGGERE